MIPGVVGAQCVNCDDSDQVYGIGAGYGLSWEPVCGDAKLLS